MPSGPPSLLRPGRDYGLVLAATFAFALMAVFTRGAAAPILAVAAWRAVFVALVFAGWSLAAGGVRTGAGAAKLVPDRATLRLGAVYGIALAVASSTFVAGYSLTTVANTIFFHSLSPLAVFPLAWWLFKEQPSSRALAGTGIAVLGVALLSGASIFRFTHYADPRFLAGDILAFVSALGYGAVLVATRAARTRDTPILPLLTVAWSVAAVLLCFVALAFGTLALPLSAVPWVLGLAILCTNIPFYLLNLAMVRLPAGMTSLVSMAEVVFATLLGLAIYGESLAPIGFIGGGLVALGIAYPFFAGSDTGDAAPIGALKDVTQPVRWSRLGLRLVLFNVGAGLVLVTGDDAGALLVWVALVSAIRLGRAPAAELVSARAGQAVRWGVAALAGAVGFGLAVRGGWDVTAPTLGGALVALVVWLADRALVPREDLADLDTDPLASAALLTAAVGIGLAAVAHPMGPWMLRASALLVALAALGVFVAALRDADPRGVQGLDTVPAWFGQPRRLAVIAVIVLATGGLRAVPAGHVAVIERFGAPLPDPAPAGLLLRFPPPIETITLVDVASVRSIELTGGPGGFEDTSLLTGDQSLVTAHVTLYYTVSGPLAYALRSSDPAAALGALGRGAVAESVARLPLDSVLTTGRREVEERVAVTTQAGADRVGLGVSIVAVQLSKVAVPPSVQASFLDVISAEEHKRGLVNSAEAYAAQVVPKARGDAAAVLEHAAGDAAGRTADAEGASAWIAGVSAGGASAPTLTRTRLWRERIAAALDHTPLVLVPRSIRVWIGGQQVSPTPAPGRSAPAPGRARPNPPKPDTTKGASHG
ncbi:MAG: EamA family transporter [Pseudomonadota bacterium]|nr:EamA family transporter [Pseudomonadota bacterium]